MKAKIDDTLQFIYKREKDAIVQIVQGPFKGYTTTIDSYERELTWIIIGDSKFNISKIRGDIRNLSKESSPPMVEDE